MLLPLIGVIVLAKVPAWDVAPAHGKLVVVDDTFLTVSAYDTTTGKRAWTSPVIKEARGGHSLHLAGKTLLAWFGQTLSSIDVATGKVKALGTRGYNGVQWRDGGCGLDVVGELAAQRCQCSFQLFDPTTNKDVGKRYEKTYIDFHETDENGNYGSSGGCYGTGDALLGRAGKLALISAEDDRAKKPGAWHGTPVTAAIDLATGKEAWSFAEESDVGGTSLDGKTCWFHRYIEPLVAHDCTTGKRLWTTTPMPAWGRHHVIPTKRGLFELRSPDKVQGTAAMHDERTGKVKWLIKLPPETVAWPRGETVTSLTGISGSSVQILDPATGNALATVAVSSIDAILPDRKGGFVVATTNAVIAYDADGKETGRIALKDAVVQIGDSLITARLANELVVLDRGSLTERGRVSGHFNAIHVEGALGMQRIAAFAYDGKTIGMVTMIRSN